MPRWWCELARDADSSKTKTRALSDEPRWRNQIKTESVASRRLAASRPAQGQEVNWNTLPTISRPVGICQVKRAVFTTLSAM